MLLKEMNIVNKISKNVYFVFSIVERWCKSFRLCVCICINERKNFPFYFAIMKFTVVYVTSNWHFKASLWWNENNKRKAQMGNTVCKACAFTN